MSHFGIICPSSTGHLNTMLPLGQELQRRGHSVTLFGLLDAESKTRAAGIEFQAFAESEFPKGSTAKIIAQLGQLQGLSALQFAFEGRKKSTRVFLENLPPAMKAAGVDALLVDQLLPEGGLIAKFLDVPFITVCSALIFHQNAAVPPVFMPWEYNTAWWAKLRNQAGYAMVNRFLGVVRPIIEEYRQKWNLPAPGKHQSVDSPFAQISQQPVEFEFPRNDLPPWFHFTGPYHNPEGREPVPFPFEKLTGQPLIYASMGTLQNRQMGVFQTIAEACLELDAQLVISLGGGHRVDELPQLPGSSLVVDYAPQLELLQKATLMITHAGLNTTLECLTRAVPMVAIPIGLDQPGVAARIAWTGVGEAVPLKKLSVKKLQKAIEQVLTEDSYKKNAVRLQEAIGRSGGVRLAADIIERVASTGQSVCR